MRQEARTALEVMRAAQSRDVWLTPDFMEMLKRILPLSDQEYVEIFEILAADIREQYAGKPSFEFVKQSIEHIKEIS